MFDHWVDVLINTIAPPHWLNSVAWPVDPVLKFRDIPDCLQKCLCSQHFSTSLQLQNITEFFSFVKEWHLQKHSSRAEGDVLIEGKESVLVVFFLLKKKGAIACHKTSQLVPDPQQSSCSSCSHSRKIRVIYNFLPQFVKCTKCTLAGKIYS